MASGEIRAIRGLPALGFLALPLIVRSSQCQSLVSQPIHRPRLFARLALAAVLLVASVAQAETQASCNFSFFQTTFFTPPLSNFGQ
jgi:hypothetical protein